ncbi:AAA family ATPase [Sandaracinobacteroides hominis]|uniref:AAA family ATPase n=1 Tax=Sandaracinobacteroides hominis TaxID=2780086 RepID=UPI0018F65448|nr:AAA family ATPase [Sandaracinobacteroides hominis]
MNGEVPPEEAVPEAAAAGSPPSPPRLKTLTLRNFRAFPGPAAVPVPLGGRNVAIFGENGSGKSTIFHALDGFFSVAENSKPSRRQRLENNVNLFSSLGISETWVEAEFDDGSVERWDKDRHPCDPGGGLSERVFAAGYRKAFLDYRALLETNFRHSGGAINLFDICVQTVLRDYRTAHDGSEATIRDLWFVLRKHISPPRGDLTVGRDDAERNYYRTSFNTGIGEALDAMVPFVNEMLKALGWDDIEVERFEFQRLTYNTEWPLKHRDFDGKSIKPVVKFNGEELASPHLSLNEARQSALALAIYFAGRKLCAATTLADVPKIMVLDDVIVSLDQSNRLPILNLLAEQFREWQIIILTHDRLWFDMTRSYHRRHKADKFWNYLEIHAGSNLQTPPTPLPVSSSSPSDALDLAKTFLNQGHINAAGNAVRISAERTLREFCEVKSVPVRYKVDSEKVAFSDLMSAVKSWSNSSANGQYNEILEHLQMYTEILLNRLSHGGTSSLERYEVQGAIVAVDALMFALKALSTSEMKQRKAAAS